MTDEPLDSADFDALVELEKLSAGWALVKLRIQTEITRRLTELENDGDATATAAIRGGIRALRLVLRIPEILKSECKTNDGN